MYTCVAMHEDWLRKMIIVHDVEEFLYAGPCRPVGRSGREHMSANPIEADAMLVAVFLFKCINVLIMFGNPISQRNDSANSIFINGLFQT